MQMNGKCDQISAGDCQKDDKVSFFPFLTNNVFEFFIIPI